MKGANMSVEIEIEWPDSLGPADDRRYGRIACPDYEEDAPKSPCPECIGCRWFRFPGFTVPDMPDGSVCVLPVNAKTGTLATHTNCGHPDATPARPATKPADPKQMEWLLQRLVAGDIVTTKAASYLDTHELTR